jgi:triosephosphate isomerase
VSVREAVQAKREEQKLAFEKFKEDARQRGKFVRLTKAQLEHLSASYDPREMTREEYQAFIDDLCEYGVLDEADKDYITKIARFVKERTGGMDVVYGGGLKADNAAMLASIEEIDGGLIALTRFQGEIGFYPEEYLEIIRLYLGK